MSVTSNKAGVAWQQRLANVQFLRFLVVGTLNTGFSYGVYALLLFAGLDYWVANFGSFILGLAVSFRTQGALVFQNAEKNRFVRFLLMWLLLFALNIALIALFIRCGFNTYWAGALALGPIVLTSYGLQRFFVFRP